MMDNSPTGSKSRKALRSSCPISRPDSKPSAQPCRMALNELRSTDLEQLRNQSCSVGCARKARLISLVATLVAEAGTRQRGVIAKQSKKLARRERVETRDGTLLEPHPFRLGAGQNNQLSS